MKIFCYRYMWRLTESDESLRFKIVTDTESGLAAFESQLFLQEKPLTVLREYLCEYDVSKIAVATRVLENDDKNVENDKKNLEVEENEAV